MASTRLACEWALLFPPGASWTVASSTSPFEFTLSFPLGSGSLTERVEVAFLAPSDYPFKPPKVTVVPKFNEAVVYDHVRYVCPELLCWSIIGQRFSPNFFPAELRFPDLEHSLPPACSLLGMAHYLEARFAAQPLHDVSALVLANVPSLLVEDAALPDPPRASGVVHVRCGFSGEALPTPSGDNELFLMADPNYVWCRHSRESEPLQPGPFVWTSGRATFCAVAAPFCPGSPLAAQAMRLLLANLAVLGWTRVTYAASGIFVPFLKDIPGLVPNSELVSPRINKGVVDVLAPKQLRPVGWSVGETPGTYGVKWGVDAAATK